MCKNIEQFTYSYKKVEKYTTKRQKEDVTQNF